MTILASICVAFGLSAQAPAAKAPARNTSAERLEFMKESARSRGWSALRLLPTPISRYGKTGGTPEDGALFAFVLATDPEIFLFIEARPGASALEWQYAFALMTCWALKAEHKGHSVWSLPLRSTDDPSKPFFDRTDRP